LRNLTIEIGTQIAAAQFDSLSELKRKNELEVQWTIADIEEIERKLAKPKSRLLKLLPFPNVWVQVDTFAVEKYLTKYLPEDKYWFSADGYYSSDMYCWASDGCYVWDVAVRKWEENLPELLDTVGLRKGGN